MKVLVTGGAGYIGCHTVDRLIHRGHEVVVLDDLSSGREASMPDIKWIKDTIGNADLLAQIFKEFQFDGVIHLAAFCQVNESVENPIKYYQNNVQYTLTLLDKLVEHHIKYFVFSSSAAVFGKTQYVPIDENHPKNPINPYGRSKWIIEQLMEDYQKAYGLHSISLRYFNVAGYDQDLCIKKSHLVETHLIPLLLQAASGRRPGINIYGNDHSTPDGTCIRDYIHVIDIANANVLAIEKLFRQEPVSPTYNLGSGKGYSVKEVINTAKKITEKNISVSIQPCRKGDPAQLIADNSKACQELEWRLECSDLETILKSAWNFELTCCE